MSPTVKTFFVLAPADLERDEQLQRATRIDPAKHPTHPDDDRAEMEESDPGDVAIMDPGHDVWVVGDQPNVLIELPDAVKQIVQ